MFEKIQDFIFEIAPMATFLLIIRFFARAWDYVRMYSAYIAIIIVICVAYALINTAIQDRKRKKIT